MENKCRLVKAFKKSDHRTNIICTTNYRWWNFIPLNLYKQFHRAANWFFLSMLVLNWVPQLNAVGKYFSVMPMLIVLASDAIKDLYEDIRRGRQDDKINGRFTHCYNSKTGKYFEKKWRAVEVGDVIKILCKEEVPADILIIDTSDEFGYAFADTSSLDGETNLKQRSLSQIPGIESTGIKNLQLDVSVDLPNNDLSKLNGFIHNDNDNISLNLDNFILRGSQLRNTDFVVGLVVYAGHDTKTMQNNKGSRTKISKIERRMNGAILIMLLALLIICFISAVGQYTWLTSFGHPWNLTDGSSSVIRNQMAPYITPITKNFSYVSFLSYFTFIIIFNTLIPMSLYILLEITKLVQIWFIQKDEELCGERNILCRSMSIAEDLGQVQYIFSDKTGTLTENKMVFKCLTVCKRQFGSSETGESTTVISDNDGEVRPFADPGLVRELKSSQISDYKSLLIAMTVCNTVMVTSEGRRGTSYSQYLPQDFRRIAYEAESPDELSLVNAAKEYGFILLRRTPESCVVRQQETIMRYKVLCVLPFDSQRKCMSIIVIHPRTMNIIMYTKGADGAVFTRLRTCVSTEEEETKSVTMDHINFFAKKGLRTLAVAYKTIEQAEYQQFIMRFRQASTKLEGRAEAISKVCSSIEQHLILLGGTGVEDKLQEAVPQVLSSFRDAGIVVWVLTGDKQETAVSIGYSSGMYSRDTRLLQIRTTSVEETRDRVNQLMDHSTSGQILKQALIINGSSIEFLLDRQLRRDFLALCQTCQTVICCRVTPLQKSLIVSVVREELKVMTLAVGDGANDVGMLRQADIGIGIAGREGTQAVMSSDFAIEKFKMLQKLVLVHGHWTYNRITDFIFYFFYKNLFNVVLTLIYQFHNGFSGSFPSEELMIVTFNTFWTTPGTFVSFVLNQYGGSSTSILADPSIYRRGRLDECFNMTMLLATLSEAIYHGALVFSIHAMSSWDNTTSKLEFGGGLTFISVTIMNLMFFVLSPNITVLLAVTVLATLLLSFGGLYFYGTLDFIYRFFNEDPHYTFAHAITNPVTWANLVIVIILAFIPRILLTVFVNYNYHNKRSYSVNQCWARRKRINFGWVANKDGYGDTDSSLTVHVQSLPVVSNS